VCNYFFCLIPTNSSINPVRIGQERTDSRKTAGCRWLTPIIVAVQEAEIRRIAVPSQPRQTDPIWTKHITKKGLEEWLKW
jgi:hypothetical protein